MRFTITIETDNPDARSKVRQWAEKINGEAGMDMDTHGRYHDCLIMADDEKGSLLYGSEFDGDANNEDAEDQDPASGTELARAHPESAARVVITAFEGGGDFQNAWDVLESAFGHDGAKQYLQTACAQREDRELFDRIYRRIQPPFRSGLTHDQVLRLMEDIDKGSNIFGELTPAIRQRVWAVIDKPTQETWADAHGIILNREHMTTLWQALLHHTDYDVTSGPSYAEGEAPGPWSKLPTSEQLIAAVHAVANPGEVATQ